jgi:hypothetical protein
MMMIRDRLETDRKSMVLDQVGPNVIHGHIGVQVHVIITAYGPC